MPTIITESANAVIHGYSKVGAHLWSYDLLQVTNWGEGTTYTPNSFNNIAISKTRVYAFLYGMFDTEGGGYWRPVVVSLDLQTGLLLWQQVVDTSGVDKFLLSWVRENEDCLAYSDGSAGQQYWLITKDGEVSWYAGFGGVDPCPITEETEWGEARIRPDHDGTNTWSFQHPEYNPPQTSDTDADGNVYSVGSFGSGMLSIWVSTSEESESLFWTANVNTVEVAI